VAEVVSCEARIVVSSSSRDQTRPCTNKSRGNFTPPVHKADYLQKVKSQTRGPPRVLLKTTGFRCLEVYWASHSLTLPCWRSLDRSKSIDGRGYGLSVTCQIKLSSEAKVWKCMTTKGGETQYGRPHTTVQVCR
jgi:hypothetical protein